MQTSNRFGLGQPTLRPFLPGFKSQAKPSAKVETVTVPQDLPDISGFARHSESELLAVRDVKLGDDAHRLLVMNERTGTATPVPVDWSKTGQARDLEAIAPGKKKGEYLAVEGSSWKEHKARLFELDVDQNGATSKKSHVLPEFGQEIEGLVALEPKDGKQTLLFAGRGGNGQKGRLYWGELDSDGLSFSKAGLKGKAVSSPHLGEGQRAIADLAVDGKGGLWGSAVIDDGDEGPFQSQVYQLGELTPDKRTPFRVKKGESFEVPGTKAEALEFTAQGTIFVGSDDEALGGRLSTISGFA